MKNLTRMFVDMQSLLKDEKGQTMVEYALLIALVAVMLIGGIGLMRAGVAGTFTTITGSL
jgi:pilus assembly protein Flp/PilA